MTASAAGDRASPLAIVIADKTYLKSRAIRRRISSVRSCKIRKMPMTRGTWFYGSTFKYIISDDLVTSLSMILARVED